MKTLEPTAVDSTYIATGTAWGRVQNLQSYLFLAEYVKSFADLFLLTYGFAIICSDYFAILCDAIWVAQFSNLCEHSIRKPHKDSVTS